MVESALDEQTRAVLTYALRVPVGQYMADRSSQLSGIPRSTLYDWRSSGTYEPDHEGHPANWSYRDLIFLRILAWLRQGGMARNTAAVQVGRLKSEIAGGEPIRFIRATKKELMVGTETVSRTSGASLLPFEHVLDYIRAFDIEDPVQEMARKDGRLWAPNLVMPSEHTAISPVVLAGDPCIRRTRIPTASIYALRKDRGLEPADIVELYPGLTASAVADADLLERRLRGDERPEPVAA